MNHKQQTLLCWHADKAGFEVLQNAVKALRNRKVRITDVIYLVQNKRLAKLPQTDGITLEQVIITLPDPTHHTEIYERVRDELLPRISVIPALHINVSPGTPAMHSVWLILHCGGRLGQGTRLWSSQFNRETKRTRIDPVTFAINTYLSELRHYALSEPDMAIYEPEARSPLRRAAFERLQRYAQLPDIPLLVMGERGTGKTRLVETLVRAIKQKPVVALPCGGLDSELADSLLFGHSKGAFTGAASDRAGALQQADGGILFLDEVQDLPKVIQRKLLRVFQDRKRRYRPLGSDLEKSVDVELVCASNRPIHQLREMLDPDLFDRLAQLIVEIPPLRDCRDDLTADWQQVWRELRSQQTLPKDAPCTATLLEVLKQDPLPGNMRDLQRLAVLIMAWWIPADPDKAINTALNEWHSNLTFAPVADKSFSSGSRSERIKWFKTDLAKWAKQQFGTWKHAAAALGCNEKTLREDGQNK